MLSEFKMPSFKPIVALMCAVLLAACEDPAERAEKYFQQGLELVDNEQFSQARLEFRNAVRLDETHAQARYQLGLLAEREGNIGVAFRQYTRLIEIDPENWRALAKLGRFYAASQRLEEARDFVERAYEIAPDEPEVQAARAATLFALGDRDTAIEMASAAVKTDPERVDAHVILLQDLAQRGEVSTAIARVDDLLDRSPDDPTYNLMKLRLLSQTNDQDAIKDYLITLVDRFPEQMQFRQLLAQMHIQAGDLEAAELQLRAIADVENNSAEGVLTLTRFLMARDGEAAGVAELETRIDATDDPEALGILVVALSEIKYRSGDIDGAREVLRSEIDANTDATTADSMRIQLARIELATENQAAGDALVEEVLARDADNVDALSLRASLQMVADAPDDAIITLRRALNLEPRNVRLLLLEAQAQEMIGNFDLAQERLGAALRVSEYNPDIALRFASFLRGQGEERSARTVLDETSRRYPNNRDVLTALAEALLRSGDLAQADAIAERLRMLEGDGGDTADRIAAASLAQQGRMDESIKVLEGVVMNSEGGGDAGALAGLVSGYVRAGDVDRATGFLEELIAANPKNVTARQLLAEVNLFIGKPDLAEQQLEEAIAAAPERAAGYLSMARFLQSQGRATDAEVTVEAGLEAAPDNAALALMHAQMLEAKRDYEGAISVYEDLYARNPASIVVANNLASLIADFRRDDEGALARAQRISRRLNSSEIPHFQDTYGWIAHLNGSTEEAIRYLEPAAAGLPNNPLVRYHLAQAYVAAGNVEGARQEFNAALELDPAFPHADSARARLEELASN
jgi:tetratricopeptide (TPR) repeat protein